MPKRLPKLCNATTCVLCPSKRTINSISKRYIGCGIVLFPGGLSLSINQGRAHLRQQIPAILEDDMLILTPLMRRLLDHLWEEWKSLELQIEAESGEIERIARADAACQRLREIPGIGPLVATAIVAAIGNGSAFRKGREFAAWLGLVPRQHSTGGKARLLGISKRGNPYLRRLLIHGARSVVSSTKREKHTIGDWMNRLESRAHRNVLVVALANKLARIAWAVLAQGENYRATSETLVA